MSFPSTLSRLSTEALLEIFALSPRRLREAIDGLSRADMLAHPRAGKWSIQQIVLHVVDAEIPGYYRMLSVIGSRGERPRLPGYDQEAWTENFGYETWSAIDVRDALHQFDVIRRRETSLLRRLDPPAWNRQGVHGEWGSITLRQLLELYTDHPERHIDQIALARRRLGKPIDIPPLLDDWLYGTRP